MVLKCFGKAKLCYNVDSRLYGHFSQTKKDVEMTCQAALLHDSRQSCQDEACQWHTKMVSLKAMKP